MITPHNTESALAHTLHYLVQIQKELRKLLRECAVGEPTRPRHSLYSSKRIFRADELHLGLNSELNTATFSSN